MVNEGLVSGSPSNQDKQQEGKAGKGERTPWRPLPSDLAESLDDVLFISVKQEPMEEDYPTSDFSINSLNTSSPNSNVNCQSLQQAQPTQQAITAQQESPAEPDSICEGADVVPPLIPLEVSSTMAILTFSEVTSSHYESPAPMDTAVPQQQTTPQTVSTSVCGQKRGAITHNAAPNDWVPASTLCPRNTNPKATTRARENLNFTTSKSVLHGSNTSDKKSATCARPRGTFTRQTQRRPAPSQSARRQAGPSSTSERHGRPQVAKRKSTTPPWEHQGSSAKVAKPPSSESGQAQPWAPRLWMPPLVPPNPPQWAPPCGFCGSHRHWTSHCQTYRSLRARANQAIERGWCSNCIKTHHSKCIRSDPCGHCRESGHHQTFCVLNPWADNDLNMPAKHFYDELARLTFKPTPHGSNARRPHLHPRRRSSQAHQRGGETDLNTSH